MNEPTQENRRIGNYDYRFWKDAQGWWFQLCGKSVIPALNEPQGPFEDSECKKRVKRAEPPAPERSRIGERTSGPGGGVQTNRGFYSGD